MYLRFVAEFYTALPFAVAFVHGDLARHAKRERGGVGAVLRRLRCLDRVSFRYFPLAPRERWIRRRAPQYHRWRKRGLHRQVHECWKRFLSFFGLVHRMEAWPGKTTVSLPCCAQFAVSRTNLRRYPRSAWAGAYRLLASEPFSCAATVKDHVGPWVRDRASDMDRSLGGGCMEHLHHVVFGGVEDGTPLPMNVPGAAAFRQCAQLEDGCCEAG